ncbi:hypothetical protein MJO29_003032, partial [Puccinia striiformis f. sp. tritici]
GVKKVKRGTERVKKGGIRSGILGLISHHITLHHITLHHTTFLGIDNLSLSINPTIHSLRTRVTQINQSVLLYRKVNEQLIAHYLHASVSIFFLGSAGFIYCTISAFMILLFPIAETDTGKIGHHPYFISYDLLAKIPAVGLTLFMAIIGTCISLVMIKQALKDHKRTHSNAR